MNETTLVARFSSEELCKIINEALLYQCACPAQVAELAGKLRQLYAYQQRCREQNPLLQEAHERIAGAVAEAHAVMEACLDDVLTIEQWDRGTLEMPATLRQRRDELIEHPF